jgi:hypothetical protein
MAHLDKLEGKTANYVDESTSKQYEFGMPPNFYDNQGLYAMANKSKLEPIRPI